MHDPTFDLVFGAEAVGPFVYRDTWSPPPPGPFDPTREGGETVQVGPFRYTVRSDPQRILELRVEARHPFATGFHSQQKQEIDFDPALAPDVQRETELHESLHAMWARLALNEGELSEERVISALAPELLDFLRRNPRNTEWLLTD